MADRRYYAVAGEPKGPVPFEQLIEALSKFPDAGKIPVWRHGFEKWKPVDHVQEIAAKLSPPAPLSKSSILDAAPIASEPAISEAEAGQVKDANLPAGLGGWLIVIGIGQVLGSLRLIGTIGGYVEKLNTEALKRFPVVFWGEAAMYFGLLIFVLSTTSLFFGRSRKFPAFFIWQFVLVILLPFIDAAWAAFSLAAYTGRGPNEFFSLTNIAMALGQGFGIAIGGGIWVAYILRSERVANTFIK